MLKPVGVVLPLGVGRGTRPPGGRDGHSPSRRPGGPAPKRWQRRPRRPPVTPRGLTRSRRPRRAVIGGASGRASGSWPPGGRSDPAEAGGTLTANASGAEFFRGSKGAEHPSPELPCYTRGMRNVRGSNYGRRSRKFNQGCTIRHSCPWAGRCWTVLRKRENQDDRRENRERIPCPRRQRRDPSMQRPAPVPPGGSSRWRSGEDRSTPRAALSAGEPPLGPLRPSSWRLRRSTASRVHRSRCRSRPASPA